MKKTLIPLSLLITSIITVAFIIDKPSSISIGTELPKGNVGMKDVSGKEITLQNSKKENGLLVVFSCNTCPFVIKQEATTLELGKLTQASKVGYVIINSNEAQRNNVDSYEKMKKYASKQGYGFSYTVDENSVLADAFGATRTPEAFLFDKNMKLVYKGAFTDDTDPKAAKVFYIKDALSALRDGKEIKPKTTKSVGCTIKRVKKESD